MKKYIYMYVFGCSLEGYRAEKIMRKNASDPAGGQTCWEGQLLRKGNHLIAAQP